MNISLWHIRSQIANNNTSISTSKTESSESQGIDMHSLSAVAGGRIQKQQHRSRLSTTALPVSAQAAKKTSTKGFDFARLPNDLKLCVGREFCDLFKGTTSARTSTSKVPDARLGGAALMLANKELHNQLKHDHLRSRQTEIKRAAELPLYLFARKMAKESETFFVKNVVFDDVAYVYSGENNNTVWGRSTLGMKSPLFRESAIEHVELRSPSTVLQEGWFLCIGPIGASRVALLKQDRIDELKKFDDNAANIPRSLKTWTVRKRDTSFWLTAALRGATCKVCARSMRRDLREEKLPDRFLEDEVSFSSRAFDWAPYAAGHTHDPALTGEMLESFDDAKQLALLGPERRAKYRRTAAYREWKNQQRINVLLAGKLRLHQHKAVCEVKGACRCPPTIEEVDDEEEEEEEEDEVVEEEDD